MMKLLKVLLIALCIVFLCSCGRKDVHTNESVINESAAVQELFEAVEDMSRKAEKAAFELTEKEQALEDEINQKIADMEAAQEEGSSENETAKSIKEIAKEKLGLVNSDEILFKEENQD